MQWLQALLSWEWTKVATGLGIAGILAGVSKSVADHWLGQRKDRAVYRRAKLAEWRAAIYTWEWSELGSTSAYAELRRYIPRKVIVSIEHPRTVIFPGGRGGDPRKQTLLDEIARIERSWNLI
jgi:hypothetical protein